MTRFFTAMAMLASLCLMLTRADAQTVLLEEVHTIPAPGEPRPVERAFSTSAAGNYEVVLTDMGAPGAPLAGVHLAVTRGGAAVGTPIHVAGTLTFMATANTAYKLHISGRPGSGIGSGLIRVVVRPAGTTTAIEDFIDMLAPPSGTAADGQFIFEVPLSVTASGNYDVVLRDLQWPQTMSTLLLAVVEEGGPLVTSLSGGAPSQAQSTVALTAGTPYRVFAIAVAPTPEAGGVYNMTVRPTAGGTATLSRTIGIAGVAALGSIDLAAGAQTLRTTDLSFPVALDSFSALLVSGGVTRASSNAGGDVAFTASAAPYEVFAFAMPAATPGGGSLAVQIVPAGQAVPVFSKAQTFTRAASGLSAHAFPVGTVNGSLRLRLADYQFPDALLSLRLAAVQGTALLGTPLTTPGTQTATAANAPLELLVFAQSTSQGGLFGVDVEPAGGGAPLLELTQSVGRAFSARVVDVTTAGRYDVSIADLGFPASFVNLAAAVTRGSDRVGLIFGSGRFDFAATPGRYFVNFIAQPDATLNAGTYSLSVASRPPAPVISLVSSATRVTSGGTVSLTWSATQATSCAATGGWSGARATSGTETSTAISAATTFTLTCTGPGGDAAQSVSIETMAPASGGGGGGGGGALGPFALLMLAIARLVSSRIPSRSWIPQS